MIVLQCTSADPGWANVLTLDTGSPDGSIQCSMPTSVDDVALVWRVQDADNYCALWTDDTYSTFTLGYIEDGSPVVVDDTGATDCSGVVRVEVDGDDVIVYLDDVSILETQGLAGVFEEETRFGVACHEDAAATAVWSDVRVNDEVQQVWSNVVPENDYMMSPPIRGQLRARSSQHASSQEEWGGIVHQEVEVEVIPGP